MSKPLNECDDEPTAEELLDPSDVDLDDAECWRMIAAHFEWCGSNPDLRDPEVMATAWR